MLGGKTGDLWVFMVIYGDFGGGLEDQRSEQLDLELAELERKKEELERQKKSFAQSRKELSLETERAVEERRRGRGEGRNSVFRGRFRCRKSCVSMVFE